MKRLFSVFTTVADRIILGFALLLLVWLYQQYWIKGKAPIGYALIRVSHQTPIKVDLQHPQKIAIQGHLGESLIEVTQGGIRFIASPCRNKHCIHAGWLSANRDFVACLPNQVSIELHRHETVEFDAIVY